MSWKRRISLFTTASLCVSMLFGATSSPVAYAKPLSKEVKIAAAAFDTLPANNTVNVPIKTKLAIFFATGTTYAAGSGKIKIIKPDNTSIDIDPTDPSVTISGDTVIINPGVGTLVEDTWYTIEIPEGAFVNTADLSQSPLMSWRFQTGKDDVKAPLKTAVVPANAMTPIDSTNVALKISFDEPVFTVAGKSVKIYNSATNALVESIEVRQPNVTGNATTEITIKPTLLTTGEKYYVQIDSGAFTDASGNPYAGIGDTSWEFRTTPSAAQNIPPVIDSMVPADNSTDIAPPTELMAHFSKKVSIAGTATAYVKVISDNTPVASVQIKSTDLDPSGQNLKITLNNPLAAGTAYYVLIDGNSFQDEYGNYFEGINDALTWNFTTKDTVVLDKTAVWPSGSATINDKLKITFNKKVYPGSGNIVLRKTTDSAFRKTIQATHSDVTGGGTTQITINPGVLAADTQYYVEIDNEAFKDAFGVKFAGISGPTGWSFKTASTDQTKPTVVSLTPADDAINVRVDETLLLRFSEPVKISDSTKISLYKAGSASRLPITVDLAESQVLRIKPKQDLLNDTPYYVIIDPGAIKDNAENAFAGISTNMWNFRTMILDRQVPVISSSVMSNESYIVLTYDKALDTASVPATVDFRVSVNGSSNPVTNVAVNGTTVTLTLQYKVPVGQNVVLTYIRGVNPIQDISKNKAVNLSNRAVVNTIDTTLPTITSATVSGALMTLNYSEPVFTVYNNLSYTYLASQFSATVDGYSRSVTNASISGSSVLLTLDYAVTDGQTISMNYTQGGNPLKDATGNYAANLSGYYVRNMIDTKPPEIRSAEVRGTTLTLTYNEGLNEKSIPPKSAYVVKVDNAVKLVTAVAVKNDTVTLTLNSAVKEGQVVEVSFTQTSTPLQDLAKNNAVGLTSYYVTNATDSTPPQISDAVARGKVLTLTYDEELSAKSIPPKSLFTVYVDDKSQPIASTAVSGRTVTLTMQSAVPIGANVTVSYAGGGTGTRDASNNVAASFLKFSATNETSWGDTLPDYVEAIPNRGGIRLKTTAARTATETSLSGLTVNKYTPDTDKLTQALALLKDKDAKEQKLTFTVPSTEKAGRVTFPAKLLETAVGDMPDLILVVEYDTLKYELPLQAVDFTTLAESLGVETVGMRVNINMERLTGSKGTQALSDMGVSSSAAIAEPIDFTVTATGNGNQDNVALNAYVTRTVKLNKTVNANETSVVWFDPQTKKLTFVPATFKSDGANTIVTIKRRGNSAYAIIKNNKTYSDISNHWGRKEIELLLSKMVVDGATDNNFMPNSKVTRAEFAIFIARALGLSGDKDSATNYIDIESEGQLASYIGAASVAGIIQGNPDGSFQPNYFVTREQMALMMVRALEFTGKVSDVGNKQEVLLSRFGDNKKISPWAREAVAKAINAGIINGVTTSSFQPKNNATRAEAVAMIKRLLQYVEFMN